MDEIFWSLRQNVHEELRVAKMIWERVCVAGPDAKPETRIEDLSSMKLRLKAVLDDLDALTEEAEALIAKDS